MSLGTYASIFLFFISLVSCRSQHESPDSYVTEDAYYSLNEFAGEQCKCTIKSRRKDGFGIYEFGLDDSALKKAGLCEHACKVAVRDDVARKTTMQDEVVAELLKHPDKLAQLNINDPRKQCWISELRSVPTKKNGSKEKTLALRYNDYKIFADQETNYRYCPEGWRAIQYPTGARGCSLTLKVAGYCWPSAYIQKNGSGYSIKLTGCYGNPNADVEDTSVYQSINLKNKQPEYDSYSHGITVSFDVDQAVKIGSGNSQCRSLADVLH